MYDAANKFLTNIAKYGRQFDTQIELVGQDKTLSIYDINVFTHRFNSSLFQSVMRVLEIDSNEKIAKGSIVKGKLGIKFDEEENYDYINYNNYKVIEDAEYDEDTRAYVALAYDKMHEAMIDYDLTPKFPIKVKDLLVLICKRLGWDTSGIPVTFINADKEIDRDVYSGIGYTFRNVLDELAKMTCSFPCFINDVFTLKYITETGKTITNNYLSEDDLTFIKEYFINSVVFARAEESDNFYKKDDEDIEKNGLHEYRLADLQILSTDNRSVFMDEIYEYLRTLRFWIFDVKTTGVFIFDIADRFTVQTDNMSYSVVLLNSEGVAEQGLTEQMYADEPEESETEYKSATDNEIRDKLTKLMVDKQNQTINALVQQSTETSEKVSELEISLDGISSKVSDIEDLTMTKEGYGTLKFEKVNKSEPIYIRIYPRYEDISYIYPFPTLYPSPNLYLKKRKIRFENTTTGTIIDYELPVDLLYYDENNYDEFILDYNLRTCKVTKRVAINKENGAKYVLDTPQTMYYRYFNIELEDGDYIISVLDSVNAYLFAKLMSQNKYTDMFATKVELNSSITQSANEIMHSVSETYTTRDDVNDLVSSSVGTVNLILNSDFSAIDSEGNYTLENWSIFPNNSALIEVETNNDKTWLNVLKSEPGTTQIRQNIKPIEPNQYYTFSFKLKNNAIASNEIRTNFVALTLYLYSNNDELITTFMKNIEIEDIKEEQNISYTFQTPENEDINYCMLSLSILNLADEDEKHYVFSSKITNLQLEKGKTVTNWMPSQKDFYSKVEKYSKIIQNVNQIQLTVGTKVGKDEIISSINMSSEQIKINANKIEISANDVLNILAGTTINLSSENITMSSNYFNLDSNGKVTCSNIDISGGTINLKDAGDNISVFEIENGRGSNLQLYSWGIFGNNGEFQISTGNSWINGSAGNVLFALSDSVSILSTINTKMQLQHNGAFVTGDGLYINGYKVLTNTSDKKLKKNIKSTKLNALNIIQKIKHKQFDWRENGERDNIGYIAQELEKIDSAYVHKDPKYNTNGEIEDYYYQINVLPLLATATKAIQEQQEEIKELKQKIERIDNNG